ncbi:MAG: TldD/PmbA family protein [Aestuariivirga sp.]
MTNSSLSIAEAAIEAAKRSGADAADALIINRRATDIGIREGKLEKHEYAESGEIGLRVFVGKSSAAIAGSKFDSDALARLADSVVQLAKVAPEDEYSGLADASLYARVVPDLDLADNALPDTAKLRGMAMTAEAAALAVKGVSKSDGASASASERDVTLVTSNGFAASYRRTGSSVSVSAIAQSSQGMERDYDYSAAIHSSELEAAEKVGRTAGERAVRRLDPRKVKSQAVPVVFENRIAASLANHLASAISGSSVARGTSFLAKDMGKQIFSRSITISDNPSLPRRPGSRPFDGEGLQGEVLELVKDGVLQHWLLDLRSARQLGLAPNGRASRGLASPSSPSASNLVIQSGTISPGELLKSINHGLYVTGMLGMGVNQVTGEYSRGAGGFWIENGELAYPVSEITLAGNLRDMFLSLVAANDPDRRGATSSPTLLVQGLILAGS